MREALAQPEMQRISGGVRWEFPRRELGKGRYAGLAIAGFGVVVLLFMVFWMGGPISNGIKMLREGEWFGWLMIGFGLLGLPGLAIGLAMVVGGLVVFANRMRAMIELRDGRLVAIEKIGPIKLRFGRAGESVHTLRLVRALPVVKSHRGGGAGKRVELFTDESIGAMYAIEASGPDIKPMKLAGGYPLAFLQPIAEALARRIGAREPAKLMGKTPTVRVELPPDEQDQAAARRAADQRLAEVQPAGSDVQVERDAIGLTLRVPPRGIWKGSVGLFPFGLVWTVFCVIIFGAMLLGGETDSGDLPDGIGSTLALGGFALLFLGVGVGLLVAGYHMGKRRTTIDAIDRTLLVTTAGPLRSGQREWSADDLDTIRMGPSNMEVNDQPVMCLRIEPREGKPMLLLTGRETDELRWLAATLRVELGLAGEDEPER